MPFSSVGLVARYLGPSDFGLISYSLAVIGILSTIASLGLDSWIVNRLVRNPEQRSPLLWNVTFMKIGLTVHTFFLAVLLIAGCQQFSEESSKACLVSSGLNRANTAFSNWVFSTTS